MAPGRLSYLCWNCSFAVRGCSHVFAKRFQAAWPRWRRLCHIHAGLTSSGAIVGFIKYHSTNSQAQLADFFIGILTFYLVATAWWSARREDGETGIFDWAGLLVALSVGAALAISGLEAADGPSSLKHDFPVAPYFIFGFVALLSGAGDVRMLVHGGSSGGQAHRASSVADVLRFLDGRPFFFSRPAKSNASVYSRIEAAVRTASPHTNRVDLLAVSRVVHKRVQAQTNYCQADSCHVVNSFWRYLE
jgi:hypothetical protein